MAEGVQEGEGRLTDRVHGRGEGPGARTETGKRLQLVFIASTAILNRFVCLSMCACVCLFVYVWECAFVRSFHPPVCPCLSLPFVRPSVCPTLSVCLSFWCVEKASVAVVDQATGENGAVKLIYGSSVTYRLLRKGLDAVERESCCCGRIWRRKG